MRRVWSHVFVSQKVVNKSLSSSLLSWITYCFICVAGTIDYYPQLWWMIFLRLTFRGKNCRESFVGIATRCGLEGLEIDSRRGGQIFYIQSRITWVPGVFPEVKRPGRGVNHSPKFIAEVKEEVWLHLHSPSRVNFALFTFTSRVNKIGIVPFRS